jgi:hypothetical protein
LITRAAPGDGAIVTAAALERLADQPVLDLPYAWLVLGVPGGADRDHTIAALSADDPLDCTIYSAPRPPELLTQLDTIRPILLSVAIFLALLGTLGLLHFLALSTRLRGGEFAIVRAHGFLRRQVAFSVLCQAVTVVLIGLVAGMPLGIVSGWWTWVAAVDQIGMTTSPFCSANHPLPDPPCCTERGSQWGHRTPDQYLVTSLSDLLRRPMPMPLSRLAAILPSDR